MTRNEHDNIVRLETEFRECLESKNYKKAEKIIRFLREINPYKIDYIVYYATVLVDYETDDLVEKAKKTNKAIAFLNDKIDRKLDKDGELTLKLASAYIEKKDYAKAVDVIIDNFEKIKDDSKKAVAYYQLGLCYECIQDLKTAKRFYNQSIKYKNVTGCRVRLLYIAYREKDYKESRKLLSSVIDDADNKVRIYFEDGKFLVKQLKIKEAKISYCLSLVSDFSQPEVKEVVNLINNKNEKAAKKVLKSMVNGVNKQFANLLLALLLIEDNKNKEAAILLEDLEADEQTNNVLTELIVLANISKDKQLYEQISKVNNNINDSRVLRFAKIKKTRYDDKPYEALKMLEQLPAEEQEYLFIRLMKGKLHQDLLKYDIAEEIYLSLIGTKIENAAICSLADLYLYTGQVKKAKEVVSYGMDDLQILGNLISIAIYENNFKEARKLIKNNETEENKDFFYGFKIAMALREEDYSTAKFYFEKSQEVDIVFKNKSKRKQEDLDFLIKYKNNELDNLNPTTYFQQQLVSYNKNTAIKHIGLHMKENNHKTQHTVFDPSFTPEQIYNLAKQRLNKLANHVTDKGADIYIIDLKTPIAKLGNKTTSYVKVVTTINTNDILTIHPVYIAENSRINDLKSIKQRVRK